MTRLLLTRPEADSKAFAARLSELGIESAIAPMLNIRLIKIEIDFNNLHIIVTSKHALSALAGGRPASLSVVGEHTAALARALGYRVDRVAETAFELAAKLPENTAFTYLSGKDVTQEFEGAERVVVYEAVAAESLPPAAIHALQNHTLDGVVFFSARTADIFHQLVEKNDLSNCLETISAYCMSEKIAAQCKGWNAVKVADTPTEEAVMGLILANIGH